MTAAVQRSGQSHCVALGSSRCWPPQEPRIRNISSRTLNGLTT
jgi:hypothetical protein